jgi:hypothetical protein
MKRPKKTEAIRAAIPVHRLRRKTVPDIIAMVIVTDK